MAPQAETTSDPLVVEFRETLGALGLVQRRIAQLFGVGPRSVRRWQHGDRRVPCGVSIVFRLLAAGTVTIAQVEEAAIPISVRTNGSAPPAPLLVEPAPAPVTLVRAEAATFTDSSLTTAEKVYALAPGACRWPCGDPRHPDFYFCGDPVAKSFYCERHCIMAVAREFREPRKIPPAFALRSTGQPSRISTKLSVPSYSPRL